MCLFAIVFVADGGVGEGSGCYPPPESGDWEITNNTSVSNESLVLNVNISISDQGRLNLSNVTIRFNSTSELQYYLSVDNQGAFLSHNVMIFSGNFSWSLTVKRESTLIMDTIDFHNITTMLGSCSLISIKNSSIRLTEKIKLSSRSYLNLSGNSIRVFSEEKAKISLSADSSLLIDHCELDCFSNFSKAGIYSDPYADVELESDDQVKIQDTFINSSTSGGGYHPSYVTISSEHDVWITGSEFFCESSASNARITIDTLAPVNIFDSTIISRMDHAGDQSYESRITLDTRGLVTITNSTIQSISNYHPTKTRLTLISYSETVITNSSISATGNYPKSAIMTLEGSSILTIRNSSIKASNHDPQIFLESDGLVFIQGSSISALKGSVSSPRLISIHSGDRLEINESSLDSKGNLEVFSSQNLVISNCTIKSANNPLVSSSNYFLSNSSFSKPLDDFEGEDQATLLNVTVPSILVSGKAVVYRYWLVRVDVTDAVNNTLPHAWITFTCLPEENHTRKVVCDPTGSRTLPLLSNIITASGDSHVGNYSLIANVTDYCSDPFLINLSETENLMIRLIIPYDLRFMPVVSITQPQNNTVVNQTISIIGSAFTAIPGPALTERVEISIDNNSWVQAIGTTQWYYNWNTISLFDGNYSVRIRAILNGTISITKQIVLMVMNDPFRHSPDLEFLKPYETWDSAREEYQIMWNASDVDEDQITIDLFYDNDIYPLNGLNSIAMNLTNNGLLVWNVSGIPEGKYHICGIAKDSFKSSAMEYADGGIVVNHSFEMPGEGLHSPFIVFTNPVEDEVFNVSTPIEIIVNVTDLDGVQDIRNPVLALFYNEDQGLRRILSVDETNLTLDNVSEFVMKIRFSIPTNFLQAGQFTLVLNITDSIGNISSEQVSFSVREQNSGDNGTDRDNGTDINRVLSFIVICIITAVLVMTLIRHLGKKARRCAVNHWSEEGGK